MNRTVIVQTSDGELVLSMPPDAAVGLAADVFAQALAGAGSFEQIHLTVCMLRGIEAALACRGEPSPVRTLQ